MQSKKNTYLCIKFKHKPKNMNKKISNKFIVNFIKNSVHQVESFFSARNENVVFTEDSKCFPISEVEIVDLDILTDSVLDAFNEDILMSMLIDPDTGEKLVW